MPWEEIKNAWDVRKAVEDGRRPATDEETIGACPALFVSVMQRCWAANPADRMRFSEVLSSLDLLLEQTEDTMS